MNDYDILKPLENCRFLPLYSKSTKQLSNEILGKWHIISRRTTTLPFPDYYPSNLFLKETGQVDFQSNGIAYFNYKDPGYWEISYKEDITVLKCQLLYYNSNIILYYDDEIILTHFYILVRDEAISKYNTFLNLLGHLAMIEISAHYRIYYERSKILEKTGSKNKANKYISSHQDDIVCKLCPRYTTLKSILTDCINTIFEYIF